MQNGFMRVTALAIGIAGALTLGNAHASGFQIRENSVRNLGRANAGTTVSNDASVVSNNPAAMVNIDQATVRVDLTDIDLDAHDPPEFCEWKWVEPDLLPELIVPFKREVYAAIVEGFRALI